MRLALQYLLSLIFIVQMYLAMIILALFECASCDSIPISGSGLSLDGPWAWRDGGF